MPEETSANEAISVPETPNVPELVPLPGLEEIAPEITEVTTVVMETSAGRIRIEVYPEAAPNAAARFLELVASGFYDDTPIFRIVPGFVAQFGVNWRDGHRDWRDRNFQDDQGFFRLARGTLAFAKTQMPNSASTQIFINYGDNSRLADTNFQMFGAVYTDDMAVVDTFVPVGDPSMGLDQTRLWTNGGAYLQSLGEKPAMIESATIVDDE